jgi:amidohydrolase
VIAVSELKVEVCQAVAALAEELVGISREIHAHPELCFKEVKASRLLAERMGATGVDVRLPAYGLETAFACEFGADDGPCVGIIAEYDALPGVGHACGHNIIGTAALGAALALHALGPRLRGRVRLLGTPAEEGGGGKVLMERAGAFDGLDCAMMVHPATDDMASYPLIARAAAHVVYHGRAAHASSEPEAGINALDGLVFAYQAIGAWRQHMPARHRVHGIITEGGVASNIVPERAAGHFAVRAPDRQGLEMLKARVLACFEAGALASGAKVEVTWEPIEYLDLVTNWPLADAYRANAETLGRRFRSPSDLPAGMASSTDLGNVSHRVPTIHPMIAAVPTGVAFHTIEFAEWSRSEMGMKALLDGAKAMAMTAIDMIEDYTIRTAVRAAFAAQV